MEKAIRLSRTIEDKQFFLDVFSYSGTDAVIINYPNPFTRLDHFTIFWRGYAKSSDLQKFIGDVLEQETFLKRVYDEPEFVRYEVYPSGVMGDNLSQSRYVVWANVLTKSQRPKSDIPNNEIGIYTTLEELKDKKFYSALRALISKSIRPSIKPGLASAVIELSQRKLEERISN